MSYWAVPGVLARVSQVALMLAMNPLITTRAEEAALTLSNPTTFPQAT